MSVPPLTGAQKSFLRSLGQKLDASVAVGRGGLTPAVLVELERRLDAHELVKVKLLAEREERATLAAEIERRTSAAEAGSVGRTALFYRQQADPKLRKIALPEPKAKTPPESAA